MILYSILFTIGFLLLIKGADLLVDGGSSIAKRFKIPPIVIGLTIVSFGTSAPEFLVTLQSSLQGQTDLALGNIVGSSISNIFLILGVSAIITPLVVKRNTILKEIPASFVVVLVILGFALSNLFLEEGLNKLNLANSTHQVGVLGLGLGVILLVMFAIFMGYTYYISRVEKGGITNYKQYPIGLSILMMLIGFLGLSFGGDIVVKNAIKIATDLGISGGLVGLTIVALGTSLPELAASVVAAYKGNGDIAVGNVIGSNLFNLLFVLGTALTMSDITITGFNVADLLILLVAVAILFGSIFPFKRGQIARIEGTFMLACYIAYMIFLVWRG